MHLRRHRTLLCALIVSVAFVGAFAQTRKKRTITKKPAATAVVKPTPQPAEPAAVQPEPPKRNERPMNSVITGEATNDNGTLQRSASLYRYEFTQPEFIISKLIIEHDEAGKGTISFLRRGNADAMISDPLIVSAEVLGKLNEAFASLNFLDSRESYQYEKDYSHLGNATVMLRKGRKERTATFNYTQNKAAKTLADEYRKLGNQYVWVFDITIARENQPLEAPRLLDSLDALMKRNEISDGAQMVEVLQGLSNDERLPLIARNHASRLIKKIEKEKK